VSEGPESKERQSPSEPATAVQPPRSGSNGDALPAAPIRAVWERIKHHKIVQWTLAYLALAYTLLHSAEMLGSSLGWSHGLLRLFALLLILGVPVIIVVSWYHGARGQRRVAAQTTPHWGI
jgi:hypothetical protein